MIDPFAPYIDAEDLENYAGVLLWALGQSRPLPLKNGDPVLVSFDHGALRLADAVYEKLIEAHLNPVVSMRPTPVMERSRLMDSSMGQLIFEPPGWEDVYGEVAGVIELQAPGDVAHLSSVPVETLAESGRSMARARALLAHRIRLGEVGVTRAVYPTEALARLAGQELEEYADNLLRACMLISDDPVRDWKRVQAEAREITGWLNSMKIMALKLKTRNTDLSMELGRSRSFVGVTGKNIPCPEIYVTPDWRGVNGTYFSDMPRVVDGRMVSNLKLKFEQGLLLGIWAGKGASYVAGKVGSVPNANKLGEFSLTDNRLSRCTSYMGHIILDENVGGAEGNCHIALGAGCEESFSGPGYELTPELKAELGFNGSPLHLDMVSTEPRQVTAIMAGGSRKVIYEGGRFTC